MENLSIRLVVMVITAALIIVLVNGIGYILRKIKRKQHEEKDTVVSEQVNSQLKLGEQLLCVDRQRWQPLASTFVFIIGLFFIGLFIELVFFNGKAEFTPIVFIGLLCVYWGIYLFAKQANGYFFVTNQRLAIRDYSSTFKQTAKDYSAEQIKKIEQFTYFGMHQIIHVHVDVGKKSLVIIPIVPENDAPNFVEAVRKICRIQNSMKICS